MSKAERVVLYREIEQHRKKPLIVYVTSGRPGPGAGGVISQDSIRQFSKQLFKLPKKTKSIDLLTCPHKLYHFLNRCRS